MDVLEEIGKTLEDEYENVKMEMEVLEDEEEAETKKKDNKKKKNSKEKIVKIKKKG